MGLTSTAIAVLVGAVVARTPWIALAATAVSIVALLFVFSFRTGAIAAYIALSAVYVESVFTGSYIADVDHRFRIARDVLLVLVLVGALLAGGSSVVRTGVGTQAVLAALVPLLFLAIHEPSLATANLLRYHTLVPLVGLCVGVALARRHAERTLPRLLVALATASSIVGIFQAIGALGNTYYSGYVEGFTRASGLVGQPNNQAFFLVAALCVVRYSAAVHRRVGAVAAIVLLAGVLFTFSRTGIALALAVLVGPPLLRSRAATSLRNRSHRQSRALVVVGFLIVAPAFLVAREPGSVINVLASDGRRVLVQRTISDLGATGFLLGQPELRASGAPYVTDNLYLDLLIIGGIATVMIWVVAALHLYRRVGRLGRASILMISIFGLAASSLGLFPGVLFLWSFIGSDLRIHHKMTGSSR